MFTNGTLLREDFEWIAERWNVVYTINMRKAISVTLKEGNLLWLRAQAARSGRGSVSEVLDGIVSEARLSGRVEPAAMRTVAGTIDLPDDDPGLETADAYIRSLFAASARQPMVVRERPAGKKKPSRRG
jgi:hypothetical protein